MPGSWLHLGKRFFGAFTVRDLDEAEVDGMHTLLSGPEYRLFMDQPPIDRRHGHDAATFVIRAGASEDVARAAALHDVAKRHAGLGIFGRVLASLVIKARIPVRGRFRTYRDHGPIGAGELASAGAPLVAIEYARCHHGVASSLVDPAVWALLDAADTAGERTQSDGSHR